jgi:hypothetical protein
LKEKKGQGSGGRLKADKEEDQKNNGSRRKKRKRSWRQRKKIEFRNILRALST